ncbi:nuclear transport factor 2 family protein [Streptomyces sp. Act143]|uniref:nuclear transport factor 2 family protein n=1 Tax=Streptomyces sp. Act143 TaxID=2200760 RepID=UPI000D683C05|nr:nuclear transport factor 2 family protein [Streptomyces sp. Act143]PWI12976.1 nuclear transport factor 2 family protein [Streptomyces sp. Act143]
MHAVTDLLTANLHEVFGNRDPVSRRAAIDRIYTEDVVFSDPEGVTTGRDALENKAAALLADAPADFSFTEDGRRYADTQTGALAWAFGPPDAPAVHGVDVITVRDGRIATVLTMFAT